MVNEDAAAVVAAVGQCVQRSVWSLPDAALVERLDLLQRAQCRLDAARLAVVRELDGRDLARREGATSLPVFLRGRYRLSIYAANRLVRLARALDLGLPATREALTEGEVHAGHAWVIKEALDRLPATLDPALVAQAEAAMVAQAAQLDPPALRQVGARILHHVAPELAEEHERHLLERQTRDARRRRKLTFTPDGHGGVRISGLLDEEAAAYVRAGIDALAAPRQSRHRNPCSGSGGSEDGGSEDGGSEDGGSEDGGDGGSSGRDDGERADDAFGREGRRHGWDGNRPGASPDHPDGGRAGQDFAGGGADGDGSCGLDRAVRGDSGGEDSGGEGWDERSVAQRRADALHDIFKLAHATQQLPDHGGDRPSIAVTVDYDTITQQLGIGTLDTGERLAPSVVRRLACDAKLIPSVLDTPSQPLDLGRERRLFTSPLRRALALRDGGCAFPGCDRPPKWCEAHHVVHWEDHGPTRLDNGCLLCTRHHHLIHENEWRVHIAADGMPEFTPPTWIDPHQRPQRNHRPSRISITPTLDGR